MIRHGMIAITLIFPVATTATAQQSSVTADAHTVSSPASANVVVKTGDSTTSAFRVFNSADATLLNVTASGDVGIGTAATPPERFYVYEDANVNSVIMIENPNAGLAAASVVRTRSDAATVSFQAHGSGRTLSRFGLTSLAGWAEFLSFQGNGFAMGTTHAAPLVFGTNNVNRLHIAANGRVGIGTSSPGVQLHVGGAPTQDVAASFGGDATGGPVFNVGYSGASFGRSSAFFNVRPDALAVAPNPSLRFLTGNVQRMIITNTGQVGIGTTNPSVGMTLDVAGNANFSGTVTGGNIAAKYQDLAEWVPSRHDLVPGTVVVLDTVLGNGVMASTGAYDLTVAGVVSVQPGIILGEAGVSKEQIATTGRVRVLVDATTAPIRVGDLLVTSATPGRAMRSEAVQINGRPFHQPGTIIGKALEPLATGEGEILVLLSLQ